jgi:hypothetical protein
MARMILGPLDLLDYAPIIFRPSYRTIRPKPGTDNNPLASASDKELLYLALLALIGLPTLIGRTTYAASISDQSLSVPPDVIGAIA